MAKIVYDESDSILIRNCLKIAMKTIDSMNVGNVAADAARLETIIAELESIEEIPQEVSSTVQPAKCEVCDT
jgi:hypothetical protein|tara:strand:+ start:977 stop:1192 length:216 start_codon:yes stop_codon:yes gene_type:complete